jgi:hypothetical protein
MTTTASGATKITPTAASNAHFTLNGNKINGALTTIATNGNVNKPTTTTTKIISSACATKNGATILSHHPTTTTVVKSNLNIPANSNIHHANHHSSPILTTINKNPATTLNVNASTAPISNVIGAKKKTTVLVSNRNKNAIVTSTSNSNLMLANNGMASNNENMVLNANGLGNNNTNNNGSNINNDYLFFNQDDMDVKPSTLSMNYHQNKVLTNNNRNNNDKQNVSDNRIFIDNN